MKTTRALICSVILWSFMVAACAHAADFGMKVVSTNCHPAKTNAPINKTCCVWVQDGDRLIEICVTYTNIVLTEGSGSCDIQSCPLGGNLVYCGEPSQRPVCTYSKDTATCVGTTLVIGTTSVSAGAICYYPTVY